MSCCGERRARLASNAPSRSSGTSLSRTDNVSRAQRPLLRLVYEYVGATALTVSSALTGRRYRFDQPGARTEVDQRDRTLVDGLPQLRRVT